MNPEKHENMRFLIAGFAINGLLSNQYYTLGLAEKASKGEIEDMDKYMAKDAVKFADIILELITKED